MKGNFWKKLLTFMSCIVATLGLMCFVSCAADAGSDSDDNNTDKLVLDFNGGTMHGHKTVANVKSVRVKTEGGSKKMYVCTSCLRSGKVERA